MHCTRQLCQQQTARMPHTNRASMSSACKGTEGVTHLQPRNLVQELSHSLCIAGYSLCKLRFLLQALQGVNGSCGQVGWLRCAEAVAQARKPLMIHDLSVTSTEPPNGCQRVPCMHATCFIHAAAQAWNITQGAVCAMLQCEAQLTITGQPAVQRVMYVLPLHCC